MTTAERRAELFAVFDHQTPEAREKRVLKLCAAAEQKEPRKAGVRRISDACLSKEALQAKMGACRASAPRVPGPSMPPCCC